MKIRDIIRNVFAERRDAVECEGCGCLVLKKTAVRGKSEIREKAVYVPGCFDGTIGSYTKMEEYLFTPFYCKKCAPDDITGGQ